LLGKPKGAITYTEIDGKIVYGSNSSLPLYGKIDRIERDRMIERYVEENPEMAEKQSEGKCRLMPFLMPRQTC